MTKTRKSPQSYHSWTKQEIRTMIKLWDTLSIEEIREELGGLTKNQVQYMANEMRKAGINLPYKRSPHTIRAMVKEVAKEQKKTKK